MALLTRQGITGAGVTPNYQAASTADTVVCGPTCFLHYKNTNAATRLVSVNDPTSQSPTGAKQFDPDLGVTLPATTGDKMIGPINDRFADPADGLAHITLDASAGVTVAVLYL